MRIGKAGWMISGVLTLAAVACAFQQVHLHTWREYPGTEYNDFPIPADYQEKTEWAFARLMYPNMLGVHGRFRNANADWTQGGRGVFWTTDYPRSDRHFSQALRRLTRIHVRSVEQSINLDDGDQWDWPWLYAVEVGHWNLTDAQVKAFREYLDRGGFFMCDDFHGTVEWSFFEASMRKVFPDRPIVEIENKDPIFHTIYDLDERYQVPGEQYLHTNQLWEKDGKVPHWRAIYDDNGRIMVAMCFNMDLGDSWEHADNPQYPARFSYLGIRIGLNYIVYSMTH